MNCTVLDVGKDCLESEITCVEVAVEVLDMSYEEFCVVAGRGRSQLDKYIYLCWSSKSSFTH